MTPSSTHGHLTVELKSSSDAAGMPSHPCSLWVSPTDAIYDCYSLYQKNYRISGVYKLPPDEFLGSPELEVRSLLPCPTLCP